MNYIISCLGCFPSWLVSPGIQQSFRYKLWKSTGMALEINPSFKSKHTSLQLLFQDSSHPPLSQNFSCKSFQALSSLPRHSHPHFKLSSRNPLALSQAASGLPACLSLDISLLCWRCQLGHAMMPNPLCLT